MAIDRCCKDCLTECGFLSGGSTANSRLAGVVAILPVVRHAGVAEDEPDQIGETRFAADIIRQNDNAALARLDADHRIGGLAIMTTLVKAVTLRTVEDHDTQAGVQVLALVFYRQIRTERGELMGGGEV